MLQALTMETILTEKPGTQLNRWVQEHVLGWVPWAEERNDYISVTFQKTGEKEPYKAYRDWESKKRKYVIISFSEIDAFKHVVSGDRDFSTDIREAWIVEEMFKGRKIRRHYTGELKKIILAEKGECDTYDMMHASPADRCKAALLTVKEFGSIIL